MTSAEMIAKLDALHAAGKFFGLTIWPVTDGYQINLATNAPNSWRIRRADTPSEGLALVLAMDFMDEDRPRSSAELLGESEIIKPRDFSEADIPTDPDELEEWQRKQERQEDAEAGIFD